jgi:hypothetical protein
MHAQNSAGALMRTGLAATPQQDTAQHRSPVSPLVTATPSRAEQGGTNFRFSYTKLWVFLYGYGVFLYGFPVSPWKSP